MTLLAVNSLSKTFGGGRKGAQSGVEAVVDVTFEVEAGEFLTIIGPSGCGKSTLLRLLAGLEQPDAGQIVLQGQPLPEMADRQGRFGYMPQRDTLLPWRTVLDNVVLGAELAGGGRDAARADARRLLPLFGLDGFENAWPSALSGGMRQRAALLRTFLFGARRPQTSARRPSDTPGHDILLLDEPFGALDALTRRVLQQWLLDVRARFRKTILFITHDIDEALLLGDRLLVFSPRPGRITADLAIDLPHPRGEDTALEAGFLALKRSALAHLKL